MPIERREGYRLWVGGPVAPGAAATTFGSVVMVRKEFADNAHLLRHELVHVEQFRQRGVARFMTPYLWDYLVGRLRRYPHLGAYRRIGFEVEAEWQARRAFLDAKVSADPSPPTA